ncbi:MAG: tetratricopeptide repeat protein [Alphaproteobacteria bacterium]|nr:tetratricopeptide repeat protein [Alphaproteobacteria bacterium]
MTTDSPQELLQQAAAHHQAGRLAEAEALYSQILETEPENPDALHLLGVCAYQSGRLDEAQETIARAIEINPDAEAYYGNLGLVLKDQEKLDEAEEVLRKALALNPKALGAGINLGLVLQAGDRIEEAEETLRRTITAHPQDAKAQSALAGVLMECHKPAEAETAFRRALELEPGNAAFHNSLGVALLAAGDAEAARESFLAAITIKPEFITAHNNLGNAFKALGDPEKALAVYEKAIEIDPGNAELHQNFNLALLLTGRLKEGWAEYEWRWRHKDATYRPYPQPKWDGSPLEGKTILVWGEQGIGDELLFTSMIPDLMKSGAKVLLECKPRLKSLFSRSFPNVTCVVRANPPAQELLSDDVDFHIPAGSLCQFLRPDLESFPKHEGYLTADPERTASLRTGYGGEGSFLVGITWHSKNKTSPEKSLSLESWRPVLEVPGVTFVNLQYGDTAAERAAFTAETGIKILHDEEIDPLTDMDAFAAQVAAMDLVISIANTTITTAGALDVPGWALVPFESDWVWMLDREDNPWFPSLYLYRQSARGDWGSVIKRVAQELRHKVEAS